MNTINDVPDFEAMAAELKKNLVADLEKQGMDFIHANFKDEGFINNSFEPWPERSQPSTYGLLRVNNTLFNSIGFDTKDTTVTFEADAPHAEIHNEGGILHLNPLVTEKSRRFFWAMYMKTGVEMWKGMALTKKERLNITVKIPKRQFMGHSEHFAANFNAHIIREIQRGFQKHSKT